MDDGGLMMEDRTKTSRRAPSEALILDRIAAGFRPPYRGEIWENCSTAPMGKGHGNDNQPFDIETACYLKPVFRAIKHPDIRKIILKAGVKTMKTFVVEASVAYFCAYGSGDIGFYLADIDAAKDHAKSRFWDWFWSIPSIAERRQLVADRFDDTTTGIYFSDKTLRVWPLNESATQGVNLSMVTLSDAFLAKKTGLIQQMIHRTTQYKETRKILIESQGGEEGDDFDQQWLDTDQRLLHVPCPLCGTLQPFEWERERPEDFTPTPRRDVPSLDHAAWIEHHRPLLAGKFCGFQRGDASLIKLPDGEYNEREVVRNTYYECYHCGGAWRDDGEYGATRTALDSGGEYVASRENALPAHVGFSWPQWINRRLRWGEIMLEYLVAKRAHARFGNVEKLKQWYQKTAARTWSEKITQKRIPVLSGSYDVDKPIPNEKARVIAVDCQQGDIPLKTGKFWYVARAVDDVGNMYQLARGYANSWKEWFEVKKRLQIPNENVGIDGGNYLQEILDAAAANTEVVMKQLQDARTGRPMGKPFPARSTWKILIGNGKRNSFPHPDKKTRAFSVPSYYQRKVQVNKGVMMQLNIPAYNWSNLAVKDHLHLLRQGGSGMAKFISLGHAQLPPETQAKETGELAYDKQLDNEFRTTEKNRTFWKEANPNVHYKDCECMCLVLLDLGGHIGLPAAADETANETE